MLVDRELPGQELVHGQGVATTGFFQRQETTADRGHNFGLAADHPPFGSGRWQIRNRQRTSVRPDDVFDPRAMGFCHGNYSQTLLTELVGTNSTLARLK